MEEIAPAANAVFPRKIRPPIDIAVTTLMTMGVVFLLSQFSVETASAVGCFAGFCVAAWNWLRMGRRRKALAHLIAAFGVYILILVVSALIVIGLALLFVRSVPTVVEQPAIPGVTTGGSTVVDQLQNQWVPRIGSFLFNTLVSVLVVVYLYRATARDVQQFEAANDTVEFYNFFPLLVVAAISVVFITQSTALVNHIRIAQVQHHVYCELLQPGMTHQEVTDALSKFAPLKQAVFEDAGNSMLKLMPSDVAAWRLIYWDEIEPAVKYDLAQLFVGYSTDNKLVWLGRYWIDLDKSPRRGVDTITCPWTLSKSLTAQ